MDVQDISQGVREFLLLMPRIEGRLLASGLVLLVAWMISKVVERITASHYNDVRIRYQVRKKARYITTASSVLVIAWIWFDGFTSVATFFGLVSAGLAIALRDMLIDLAGWIFIVWRKPFKVGDRIQIGDLSGDVIDIREFQFTLLEIGNWVSADQSTGRLVHVPNGYVFREAQANYTQGFDFIWDEMAVTITFESNWEKAKGMLEEISMQRVGHLAKLAQQQVYEAAGRYLIFYSKFTPIVYTSLCSHGVVLTIRYLTEPRRRRGNEQLIWEDILRAFAHTPDISFAYPTQRFYNTSLEGPVQIHAGMDGAEHQPDWPGAANGGGPA